MTTTIATTLSQSRRLLQCGVPAESADMLHNESTGLEVNVSEEIPIGYLRHEPTGYSLAVYKPISRFHALMLRWCFGVKYEKISNDKA